MQALEAMNYAEKFGFSYILTYSPSVRFRIRLPINIAMEIAGRLEELEMPVTIYDEAIEHGWVELR